MDWELISIADAIHYEYQHKSEMWGVSPRMKKAVITIGVSVVERLILYYLFN